MVGTKLCGALIRAGNPASLLMIGTFVLGRCAACGIRRCGTPRRMGTFQRSPRPWPDLYFKQILDRHKRALKHRIAPTLRRNAQSKIRADRRTASTLAIVLRASLPER